MDTLPEEIIYEIISYCDIMAIVNLSYVNKEINQITKDERIWVEICKSKKIYPFWAVKNPFIKRSAKNAALWYAFSRGLIPHSGYGHIETKTLSYFGQVDGTIPNGYGTSRMSETDSIYSGEWKSGIPCGVGIEYNKKKNVWYIGEFKNGHKDGIGKFIWPNKNVSYYCHMTENMIEGPGIAKFEDGTYCIGKFENGKIRGLAMIVDSDGTMYTGFFDDNNRFIHGIIKHQDTSGRIKGLERRGNGFLSWNDESLFYGNPLKIIPGRNKRKFES